MLNIFPARPEHYPIIQDIAFKTWGPTYGHILTQEQTDFMLAWMYSLDSINEQVEKNGHRYLMVALNDEIIGFASYEPNYMGLPKTKIHKLYVLYSSHGSGIGWQIVDHIGKAATDIGNSSLILNVNRFNKAIGFYKRTGFEIIEEEDIDIGNGYLMEDYVMEMAL